MRLGGLTLKWKILLGVVLASTLAVVVAAAIFVSMQMNRVTQSIQSDVAVTATIIAGNTGGALVFEDSVSAQNTLNSLKANANVIGAVLYRGEAPFVGYARGVEDDVELPEGFPEAAPTEDSLTQTSDYIQVVRSIEVEGKKQGVLLMRVDLSQLNEFISSALQQAVFATLISMVLSVLLALLVQRAVTQPIVQVVDALKNIAQGEGDLTQRLKVSTQDEVGQLAHWFNNFVEKVHGVVTRFRDTSERLTASAATLSETTEKTNAGVQRQQSEIDQVASAITEMSGTVQEVARNVSMAARDAEEADREAMQGKQVVELTMKAIEDLAGEIERAAIVIGRLQQDSQNIGAVLEVIGGIAEQTNLLALNAAIEAARAGEQGRGFAVVADEVRTLASRTQSSTQEIHQMIERLQAGAKEAVQVMEKGRQQASGSVERAEQAAQSLVSITQAVGVIRDMTQQIASASEQQSAVTEEINQSVINISQVASQTADDSHQIAEGSNDLSRLASDLKGLISQFKV